MYGNDSAVMKLFVVAIVFVATYIVILYGNRQNTNKVEPFENDQRNRYEIVIRTFEQVLDRFPTQVELSMYAEKLEDGDMTTKELEDEISKIDGDSKRDVIRNAVMGSEETDRSKVRTIMTRVLSRVPTIEEVDKYLGIYKDDLDSDEDQLRMRLRASDEYKDLIGAEDGDIIKNKDESVQRTAPAKRYDYRQEITDVYLSVYKRRPYPDEYDLYVPQMMNGSMTTETLRETLQGRKDTRPPKSATDETSTHKEMIKTMYKDIVMETPSQSQVDMLYRKFKDDFQYDRQLLRDYIKQLPEYRAKVSASFDPRVIKDGVEEIMGSIPGLYKNIKQGSGSGSGSGDVDTDAIATTIERSSKTTFNSDFEYTPVDMCSNDNSYANMRNFRDMDAMRMNCKRDRTKNTDMVLLPGQEWSVPQQRQPICYHSTCQTVPQHEQTALIGTLLDDADNTQIGSILPKFTYEEHV